jgi:hypothetical protein
MLLSCHQNAGKNHDIKIANRYFENTAQFKPMLGESLLTTAWCVLGLQMEGRPPVIEGSCEYIE